MNLLEVIDSKMEKAIGTEEFVKLKYRSIIRIFISNCIKEMQLISGSDNKAGFSL